jgi:hypothetical protein
MQFLNKISDNQYDIAVINIESYSAITGKALVKALCQEIIEEKARQPAIMRVVPGQLTNEIGAFDGEKTMGNLLAIYEKLVSLSGQVLGLSPSQTTMPTFHITIPQVMITAVEEEEAMRVAAEEVAGIVANERIDQEIANAALEMQNMEMAIVRLQGDNRVQVRNYIRAYNHCVSNETLTPEAFTSCFNEGLFAEADEISTIEQITEAQGEALFGAIHRLATGQVQDLYDRTSNTIYQRLIADKTILLAGSLDSGVANIEERIEAICAFIMRNELEQEFEGVRSIDTSLSQERGNEDEELLAEERDGSENNPLEQILIELERLRQISGVDGGNPLQICNQVQIINYIRAYNDCVSNETLTAEAFTSCFNEGLFAEADETLTIEQITEAQGAALFGAIHSLATGQVQNLYDTIYQRLIADKTILNAGNVETSVGAIHNFAEGYLIQREEERQRHEKFLKFQIEFGLFTITANPVTEEEFNDLAARAALTPSFCLEIFKFLFEKTHSRDAVIYPQFLQHLLNKTDDRLFLKIAERLYNVPIYLLKLKQTLGLPLEVDSMGLDQHEVVKYYVGELQKDHRQITGNPQDYSWEIKRKAPKCSIDKLFELFNKNHNNINGLRLDIDPYGAEQTIVSTSQPQNLYIDRLYHALKHFADKNQDGKLSQEQMEMLKKNSAFLDWVCSLLPHFLQVSFIADRTNRRAVQGNAMILDIGNCGWMRDYYSFTDLRNDTTHIPAM